MSRADGHPRAIVYDPRSDQPLEPPLTSTTAQTATDDDRDARPARRVPAWVKPLAGFLITVAIFAWMFKPVVRQWGAVRGRIFETSSPRFALAAAMFAAFLFVFRVTSWRYLVERLGRRLPLAPATRIWSTSELARYLPGAIWQVAGRVYLVRPYGVSKGVCSLSQLLELSIFVLANVMLTLACLPWFAGQMPPSMRILLYGASALAPCLLLLLHPRVFYAGVNRLLGLLGRPPLAARVDGRTLFKLVAWAMLGLLWQGLAIWTLAGQPRALDLSISRFGLIVGAYCLAWTAGFLAFWAPGGIGAREFVLVQTLKFVLPTAVLNQFNGDPKQLDAFLVFLSVLLRLWTIAGELIVAALAYAADYRGALGHPDAPGRVGTGSSPPSVSPP